MLALSNKQIKYILKNKDKFSAEKISKNFNISVDDVRNIIKVSNQKSPFYFYIILIIIPILFFVLLEAALILFNYGYDLSMWVKATEGKMIINPEVARRYFTSVKSIPNSIEDIFDMEKKENAFRVFVLGESSAAGYPFMPMGSFSRYIRKRLELVYPDNKIEVINISLTAINSYTIKDFIPDVLTQKPDLILIYTGHNEYYGAMGVGSLESIGTSSNLIDLYIYLNRYKTTQLIRDVIQWFIKVIDKPSAQVSSGTLMSRMAQDQQIVFGSDEYQVGLNQFKRNMEDVIQQIKENGVPVIIGTLASNLKDQKPFVSVSEGNLPDAKTTFINAQAKYNAKNYKAADSLFRYAKDLDALRFRAPEEFNRIIKGLGKKFNTPIINIDSLFCNQNPDGIVGDNLMTDHLHPTLKGYQLIGKYFYDAMVHQNYLPKNSKPVIDFSKQDSITVANFVFTALDSVIANYRIRILKNDWPFVEPIKKRKQDEIIKPENFIDSLAAKVVNGGMTWEKAQRSSAEKYLRSKNIDAFLKQIEVLITQYPVIKEYYDTIDELAFNLVKIQKYDDAYKVLLKRYQLKPNDFSAKWLGNIDLKAGKLKSAIYYLEKAALLNGEDMQILYNLAGAYSLNKEYKKGYDTISKLLKTNPSYPGAQNLYQQLKSLTGS